MKTCITKKNKDRMVKNFIEMAHINSPTYKEGVLAKYLTKKLKSLGCSVYVDKSAKKTGSDTGNIIAKFPGKGTKSLVLAAHMDTVTPTKGIKTIIKKDRICTDGKTILGGDCKSGIAVMLEVITILKENKIPHPPVELVFTAAEETGVFGSMNLEYSKLKSKCGLVLDNLYADRAVTKAPMRISLNIKITGKQAHSGVEPERGISAAEVFAKAVSSIKFGRIDSETTSNIGFIKGGEAINAVMSNLEVQAELRSHKLKKAKALTAKIKNAFEKACKQCGKKIDGKMHYAKLEFKHKLEFPNLSIKPTSVIVKHLMKSAKKCGFKVKLGTSGGASDANLFYSHGIETPNLGTGHRNAHTNDEYLNLKDFFNAATVVLCMITEFK